MQGLNLYLQCVEDGTLLKQDKFSKSGEVFGRLGQISVLGFKHTNRGTKRYVVKCGICSEDPELFQEGLFFCEKYNLKQGKLPCGCSKRPNWNVEQQVVRCVRAAEAKGLEFIGFKGGEYLTANKTRVLLKCPIHGIRDSTSVSMLTIEGNGCSMCGDNSCALSKIIPDDEKIQSFFKTRAFHPDTTFKNAGKKSKPGQKSYYYWEVYCPNCENTYESTSYALKAGFRGCACVYNQKLGYINIVYDGDLPIALKFGITSSLGKRLVQQNYWSRFKVENLYLYEFKDKYSCLNAENDCKLVMNCGILSREDMSDGYTETTELFNLEKILEIYAKHGGVRVDA